MSTRQPTIKTQVTTLAQVVSGARYMNPRAVQAAERAHHDAVARAKATLDAEVARLNQVSLDIESEHQKAMAAAELPYHPVVASARARVEQVMIQPQYAPWADAQGASGWRSWQPDDMSVETPVATRIGQVMRGGVWDWPVFPALVPLIGGKPLVVKMNAATRPVAAGAIQSALLRLLTAIPPGKCRFTFIDPLGLGQNVAPFMHLADYDEQLVTSKAWTEPQHIEQRLADLTEHMENVIQKYLRNQYASIDAYNAQAGEVAEPYRALVVFDFPANFNEASARRLVSVAQNGARCGVNTIVMLDVEKPLPYGFSLADLEQGATVFDCSNTKSWNWKVEPYKDCEVTFDELPETGIVNHIITAVGVKAREASKVEVPFERIAPPQEQWWQADSRTGLNVALGPSGARKLQHLDLGKGTTQHVLVAGRTGSGKSTLLHTMITNLALTYSPDEVEFYLIDFKKGVEFKTYAVNQLPHARVIAIESEREFGLSVLQGLEEELTRRADIFRAANVDNVTDYRNRMAASTSAAVRMPRIVLMVDEFQEFFTEDDPIATQAAQKLDRLVRQGRSFSIHILLGSQTLAGAYTLARSTMDQMGVRIALQCSEADSRLILSDDNPAARLLSRPGEAIYNAANGMIEGNNRFQVAWLTDEQRDRYLTQLPAMAAKRIKHPLPPQVVFEGNALATVEKNRTLSALLAAPPAPQTQRKLNMWLGEPIALRDALLTTFHRQSGNNLLIVGQNDEAALGMLSIALLGLAAQLPQTNGDDNALFNILDFGAADAPFSGVLDLLASTVPHRTVVGRRRQLPDMLTALTTEVARRIEANEAGAPPRFLFLYGLHRARDLRQDDSFNFSGSGSDAAAAPNPAQQFTTLLRDGPEVGVHTLVWCDTLTNLNRNLDRRSLREFAMRVAFQMSAEDSSNLIDTPAAAKLGAHRAIYANEDEGRQEKFRPYALPTEAWIRQAGEKLRAR